MSGSRVVAVGHFQPDGIMTNADLEKLVDTSDEWIRRRVGIETRHIAPAEMTVGDMATEAARHAMAHAGWSADDVDLLMVATCTTTERSPNVASRVAAGLGIAAPAAIEVNVACSGFTHALALTDHTLRAGVARRAVVVGADKLSAVTNWADRGTCVLVGDGAGAVAVEAVDGDPGIGPVVWGSLPQLGDAVVIDGQPPVFSQEGASVYRWATTVLPDVVRQTCARSGLELEDLAAIVLHQANLRVIEAVLGRLGPVKAVVARDVVESGNTSAASVPLALSKLLEQEHVESGAPILLLAFGGGLSYAGLVIQAP
ncbi:MAG TPA: beta-ketoacyl-ACP synthase III [Acidimicrobiales bacterium]|nr:beta-ketoacyl-ACP synthase III [Acidimicrobiales bacterium]